MISEKLKELDALKSKTAALEEAVQAERNAALAALPAQFGFERASALVAAVLAASGTPRRAKRRPANKRPAPARRRRAVITDETRTKVKKMVNAGKTGSQISAALKISLPSVANIKKALGLVKKRK